MRLPSILAASVVVVAASQAFAEPTPSERETARTLMAEGRELRTKGDHQGALVRFRKAHEIMKIPTTALELGKTLNQLGKLLEAREAFLFAARHPVAAGEPVQFGPAREEAAKLAESIAPQIPAVKVTVVGGGSDLRLSIDGVDVGQKALDVSWKLDPGHHVIVATGGGKTQKAEIDLAADGTTKDLSIDLSSAPAVTAPTPTPTPTPAPTPSDDAKPSRTWVYVGYGVAGVFAIGGGVLGMLTVSKTHTIRDQCNGDHCPAALHDDIATAKLMGNLSTGAFVVAGVGVVIGTIAVLRGPSVETKTGSSVQGFVGLGSLGLSGRF